MYIRKARSDDSKDILNLILLKAEFDREMKGFDASVSSTVEKINATIFCEKPFAYVILLEVKDQCVGFVLYHFRYSSFTGRPSIWLDDLFVLNDYRSKGYGFELMKALKKEANLIKASHIAWTASPLNIRGHLFYLRIGAIVERMEDKRPFYRWD